MSIKIKPLLVPLLIVALLVIFLTSRGQQKESKINDKPTIVTTINPLRLITQELVGDEAIVANILPLGASPHSFEPTPKNISNLNNTPLLIAIGHGLDDSFFASIESGNKLILEDHLVFKEYHDDDHGHDENEDHGHEGYDPHIWLSPSKALEIAPLIKDSIEKSIPSIDGAMLEENLRTFEQNIKQNFTPNSLNKKAIVFHEGWNYFADYFNLDIVFTFEPFPGKLPTPKHIIEIKETINTHNITEIYVEPEMGQEAANSLAAELGITVRILKPLGDEFTSSYFDLISYNYDTIKDEDPQ